MYSRVIDTKRISNVARITQRTRYVYNIMPIIRYCVYRIRQRSWQKSYYTCTLIVIVLYCERMRWIRYRLANILGYTRERSVNDLSSFVRFHFYLGSLWRGRDSAIRECKVSARTSDLRGLQVFCIARIILLLYRVHSDFLYVFALGGRTCCSPTKLCVWRVE